MRAATFAAVAGLALGSQPSFEAWKAKYGKAYSPEEEAHRAAIYAANVAKIEAHNAGGHAWTQRANKWTDLTGDEWRAQVSSGKKARPSRLGAPKAAPIAPAVVSYYERLDASLSALPASVNWTAAGAVTPVKDQGQCGSCWAFGSVMAIEGAYQVAKGQLISLSEQQIVSCDDKDGNAGCDGGEQITAIDWVAKGKGLCTEAAYPYTSGGGSNGKCKQTCTPAVAISAGVELKARNETIVLAALALQPISLSVDASDDAIWQSYGGGVVTAKCKCANDNCLDHAVGGAGYGTDAGVDYYQIKNSWGADWGENGYIRLARGAAYNPDGQCGVQIDSATVVV